MPIDPSVRYGATLTPPTGWVRIGRIDNIPVLVTNWDLSVPLRREQQSMVASPPFGPRQPVLHAPGTEEVTWSIRGDLSRESANLIYFLDPSRRGYQFNIQVQQSNVVDLLVGCYCEGFELAGSPNSPVTFNMHGRCLNYPVNGTEFVLGSYHHPIPSWVTGNLLVENWTVNHDIALTPVWWNNGLTLPTYYRAGESNYRIQTATVMQLVAYDFISFGIGGVNVSGMIQSRGVASNGREVRTYPVEMSNVSVFADPLTAGAVEIVNPTANFFGYPDGI